MRCRACVPAAALLAAAAPALGCGWSAAVQPLAEDSRWDEDAGNGARPVRERGVLRGVGIALRADCALGEFAVAAERARGERDYDGRSSSGAAVVSRSALRTTAWHGWWWSPAAGGTTAGWRWGALVRWREVSRAIGSAGGALGSDEIHSYAQAALAVRYMLPVGSDVAAAASSWRLEAAAGGGPPGRMALRLPTADAATLRLGSSRLLLLGAAWESAPSARGASWLAGVRWTLEHTGAGAAQALLRHGVVVGGAVQPATRQSSLSATAALRWTFD